MALARFGNWVRGVTNWGREAKFPCSDGKMSAYMHMTRRSEISLLGYLSALELNVER